MAACLAAAEHRCRSAAGDGTGYSRADGALVEYFIDHYARKARKNIKRVSKKALELIQSYPWPRNIRELQNVIERSVILCETEIFSIDESWLPKQPSLSEQKSQNGASPKTPRSREGND